MGMRETRGEGIDERGRVIQEREEREEMSM